MTLQLFICKTHLLYFHNVLILERLEIKTR